MNIIKNFHPVWFVSVMGTGISSTILYNYGHNWCHITAYILFAINTLLLLSTTCIFLLGTILYNTLPSHLYGRNNVFLGCYAMGFTSWCNMLHLLLPLHLIILSYVLWWIGIALSLFTSYLIFYNIIKSKTSTPVSSTLLLPVVPLTVVASSGGNILQELPQHLQSSTLVITYLLWANSMVLSFIITTLFINKLLTSSIPSKESVFTCFIPIGFLGQGAYAIQLFGVNHNYLDQSIIGQVVMEICVYVGLFLEIFGIFMTFIAVGSVTSYGLMKFHKGWWAMTFPLGTMSLSLNQTWLIKGWLSFRVLGVMYGVSLILITVVCLIGSLMFERPKVEIIDQEKDDEESKIGG